jgi:hypothetical protein
LNRKSPEKRIDDNDLSDDDGVTSQNIDLNLPSSAYHRIQLQGAGFSLDVCSPAFNSTFEQLLDSALYLAMFSIYDDVKDVVRKSLIKSFDKPAKSKG